jgi:hypothetical protein
MSLPDIRRVAIFSPWGATGGPEALHQLGFTLNTLGVRADMVYFGAEHAVEIEPNQIVCRKPSAPRMAEIYAEYDPQVSATIPLDDHTLVVLPEALANRTAPFRNGVVAIWWLSIDNVYNVWPQFADLEVARACAAAPGLVHLYQSVYSREFLRNLGAVRLHELGDYTSDIFTRQILRAPPEEPLCAYNAAKGGELAQDFFANHPRFEALALRGFSKAQLRDIFRRRLLYVDFGHLPGKDRLPREAAASGSIVFLHRKGAGAFYDDFPVPDFFRFDIEDVASGALAEKLGAVVADPASHWAQQQVFRTGVGWERRLFAQQVMRLLGRRDGV